MIHHLFIPDPVPVRVSAKQDAESGKYVIPTLGNASIESIKLGIPSVIASMLGQGYFKIKPNLTITVIDPPSSEDNFRQFWSSYGQTISLFIAAFLGAFSTPLIDLVNQRKKEKNQARSGCVSVTFSLYSDKGE